jgi:hypothetical protein
MIMPFWGRAPEFDSEIQSIMQTSELEVYVDPVHNCLHIMRGSEEFTSCLFPLNDQIREELRQGAYLLHNGMDGDERQRITDANEKREAYEEQLKAEANAAVQDFGTFEYKNRFIAPQVTPMFIVPEVK